MLIQAQFADVLLGGGVAFNFIAQTLWLTLSKSVKKL